MVIIEKGVAVKVSGGLSRQDAVNRVERVVLELQKHGCDAPQLRAQSAREYAEKVVESAGRNDMYVGWSDAYDCIGWNPTPSESFLFVMTYDELMSNDNVLREGDYVETCGMSERSTQLIRDAFLAAGAEEIITFHKEWDYHGWTRYGFTGFDHGSVNHESAKRLLTQEEILGTMIGHSKEEDTSMNIIQKLKEARADLEKAQSQFDNVLREVREELGDGFNLDAERVRSSTVTPTDPSEWREGDIIRCDRTHSFFTKDKTYEVLTNELDDDGDIEVKHDDDGDRIWAATRYFTWISRG